MRNGRVTRFRRFLVASLATALGACGVAPPPQAAAGRDLAWSFFENGVLVHNRAARGKPVAVPLTGWHWAGMPFGCEPDLARGPAGEAVITSDVLPVLWRIDPVTFAVSVHPLTLDADVDKDVGFTSIVYSPEQNAYFAASGLHGSLWRIDRQLTRAQKIALSAPLPRSCGVALQSRSAQKKSDRLAGLCVRSPQESWAVDFSPDQRSAYVRAESCTEL